MNRTPRLTPMVASMASIVLLAALAGCASTAASAPVSTSSSATLKLPTIQKAGTLEICTSNTGSPPNIYSDAAGNLIGSEIDLAKALAKNVGLTAQFVPVEFSSLIPSLQAKQCDVIMATLYIKPAREEIVDFVPYLLSGTAVAVPKGNPEHITGLDESVCGKKVMVTVGTTAQTDADAQSQKCTDAGKSPLQVSTNKTATLGFQQLASKQIDAYIDTAELVLYYQGKSGAQLQIAGKPFDTITVGAATIKSNPALHAALQTAFDDLQSSGSYTSILAKWKQKDIAFTK